MVLIFVGAGFSKAVAGIPDMKGFNKGFEEFLEEEGRDDLIEDYKFIKNSLEEAYRTFNLNKPDIESILTLLENFTSEDPFYNLRDPTSIFMLYHKDVRSIEIHIKKKKIVEILRYLKNYIVQVCLGAKIKKDFLLFRLIKTYSFLSGPSVKEDSAPSSLDIDPLSLRGHSFEIFSTNYDLVLEDIFREYNLDFTNGESRIAGKNIVDLSERNKDLEPQRENIKIVKLHGSANWFTIKNKEGIYYHDSSVPVKSIRYGKKDEEVIIYPVTEKIWMKPPFSKFSKLYMRFQKSLINSEIWLFVGFSFRDREIVEMMVNASEIRHEKGDPLKLYIIDPDARKIKNKKLDGFIGITHSIDKKFENVKVKDLGHTYSRFDSVLKKL